MVSQGALALTSETYESPSFLRAVDTVAEEQLPLRKTLFEKKREPQLSRKVVQYEIAFDLQKAQELHELRISGSEHYEEETKAFEGFISMQLLTALGERYNRGISEFSYRVKGDKLLGEHSDEPFEDILERGRAYREEHGDPVDHPREAAEVVGFQKMQEIMTDGETPSGTVMLTISPPGKDGSIYKHNFYDGYRKNEDGSIQAIRFSSALTPQETLTRLMEIDSSITMPDDLSDVSLLAHPLLLKKQLTLDEIHQRLHRDHEVLSEDEWEMVKEVGEVLGTSYIATLVEDPYNLQKPKEIYNAILNRADDVVDAYKARKYGQPLKVTPLKPLSDDEFYALAYRPVRAVDTGCGFSGGMELAAPSALGAYSVGEFSVPDFSLGERTLKCKECPVCKAKDIVATIANGKITCPECKASENYEC